MRKEIAEQPEAMRRTLSGRLDPRFQTTHLGGLEMDGARAAGDPPREDPGLRLCLHRRLRRRAPDRAAGAHPGHAEPASEFRYRNPVIEQDTLYIAVSQSGETFDTLAAVQEVKRKGGRVLGIVNVVGSTIARECGRGIYLHAGPGDRRGLDQDLHVDTASPSRCSPFISDGFATCRRRRARGCSRRSKPCRIRSRASWREAQIAKLATRVRGVRARLFRRSCCRLCRSPWKGR